MDHLAGDKRRGESEISYTAKRGQVIVIVSLLLVILIGVVALAVDVGYLQVRAAQAQHAADAGALAGVVFLPQYTSEAFSRAYDAAGKNGFPRFGPSATVSVGQVPGQNTELAVTVTTQEPLFFANVLGLPRTQITKNAIAQFIEPLQMGTSDYVFGYEKFPTQIFNNVRSSNIRQNFYLLTDGPYNFHEYGDPYSPLFETFNNRVNAYGFHNPGGNSQPYGTTCTPFLPHAVESKWCKNNGGTLQLSLPNPCTGSCLPAEMVPNGQNINTVNAIGAFSDTQNTFVINNPTKHKVLIKLFNIYDETDYNHNAECYDRNTLTGPNAPPSYCSGFSLPTPQLNQMLAPKDSGLWQIDGTTDLVGSGTTGCVLDQNASGTGCRTKGIDQGGGSYSNSDIWSPGAPTTKKVVLMGPGQTIFDSVLPTVTHEASVTDQSCAQPPCLMPNIPIDSGYVTYTNPLTSSLGLNNNTFSVDPTTCPLTTTHGSTCYASPFAYKFLNYAVIGPGVYRMDIGSIANPDPLTRNGTDLTNYGVAVCSQPPGPDGNLVQQTGPYSDYVTVDPFTSTVSGLPQAPAMQGWDPNACWDPNTPSPVKPGNPGWQSLKCDTPAGLQANSATCVQIYAVDHYSIQSLISGGTAIIPLGYVPATYSGKTLDVDLWDVGDVAAGTTQACQHPGLSSFRVQDYQGILGPGPTQNCIETLTPAGDQTHTDGVKNGIFPSTLPYSWTVPAEDPSGAVDYGYYQTNPTQPITGWPNAPIDVGTSTNGQPFNGVWLNETIPLSSTYGDMVNQFGGYWKIYYRIGGGSEDVTTWKMNVANSPPHLCSPTGQC